MNMSRHPFLHACLLSLLCLGSATAASNTAVNPVGAGNGSERCLAGASCAGGGQYGGAPSILGVFETETGTTFSRVDDAFDTVWKAAGNGPVMVRARSRYAGDSSTLGIDFGSGYSGLTPVMANGKVMVNDPSDFSGTRRSADFSALPASGGWSAIALATGQLFAFVLRDISMGYSISSDSTLAGYANSGKSTLDYMVTWMVDSVTPHFFIAWEDRDPRANSTGDRDYNDLVLEVMNASPLQFLPGPIGHAPEPATLLLFLLGLPLILILKRRNNR